MSNQKCANKYTFYSKQNFYLYKFNTVDYLEKILNLQNKMSDNFRTNSMSAP